MASLTIERLRDGGMALHHTDKTNLEEYSYMLSFDTSDGCYVYTHYNSLASLERFADRLLSLVRAEREKDTGDMGEDTVSLAPTQKAKQLSMAEQAALGVACGTSRAS